MSEGKVKGDEPLTLTYYGGGEMAVTKPGGERVTLTRVTWLELVHKFDTTYGGETICKWWQLNVWIRHWDEATFAELELLGRLKDVALGDVTVSQ